MSYLAQHKFSIPPDQEQIARNWEKRGYSCDLFTDPPGREWNDFVHTTNELVTVMAGKLKLTIGDEEIVAAPGDEVFIPRGVVHSVKNIASATTHWLYGYDCGEGQIAKNSTYGTAARNPNPCNRQHQA